MLRTCEEKDLNHKYHKQIKLPISTISELPSIKSLFFSEGNIFFKGLNICFLMITSFSGQKLEGLELCLMNYIGFKSS